MISNFIISTNYQKVLKFLLLHPDPCYEREIAKKTKISFGSANQVLNRLYKKNALKRTLRGRMYYYTINQTSPFILELKKFINVMSLEPLVEKLKTYCQKIVLFGSWSKGTDMKESDIDIYVLSTEEESARLIIEKFSFTEEIGGRKIQAVISNPADLMLKNKGQQEKIFLEEVEKGIILWERDVNENNL